MIDVIKTCWYALALAMLAPRILYPEEAFVGVETGKIPRRKSKVVIPDMIAVRDLGEDSWQKIGQMFGYSGQNAMSLVSRYKRRPQFIAGN